jgi:hypothetical protein
MWSSIGLSSEHFASSGRLLHIFLLSPFINNQTIDQTAEFQQRVPVTAVAREP